MSMFNNWYLQKQVPENIPSMSHMMYERSDWFFLCNAVSTYFRALFSHLTLLHSSKVHLKSGLLRSPFSLLLEKSVVIQQFCTPNSWKLLVLAWLFNHLLEPLSHLLLDLQSVGPTIESRATLACLYRTSGRFYMLQLISVGKL